MSQSTSCMTALAEFRECGVMFPDDNRLLNMLSDMKENVEIQKSMGSRVKSGQENKMPQGTSWSGATETTFGHLRSVGVGIYAAQAPTCSSGLCLYENSAVFLGSWNAGGASGRGMLWMGSAVNWLLPKMLQRADRRHKKRKGEGHIQAYVQSTSRPHLPVLDALWAYATEGATAAAFNAPPYQSNLRAGIIPSSDIRAPRYRPASELRLWHRNTAKSKHARHIWNSRVAKGMRSRASIGQGGSRQEAEDCVAHAPFSDPSPYAEALKLKGTTHRGGPQRKQFNAPEDRNNSSVPQSDDGGFYFGDFSEGVPKGQCTCAVRGAWYSGEVEAGACQGSGKLVVDDGKVVYTGLFQGGRAHGHGILRYTMTMPIKHQLNSEVGSSVGSKSGLYCFEYVGKWKSGWPEGLGALRVSIARQGTSNLKHQVDGGLNTSDCSECDQSSSQTGSKNHRAMEPARVQVIGRWQKGELVKHFEEAPGQVNIDDNSLSIQDAPKFDEPFRPTCDDVPRSNTCDGDMLNRAHLGADSKIKEGNVMSEIEHHSNQQREHQKERQQVLKQLLLQSLLYSGQEHSRMGSRLGGENGVGFTLPRVGDGVNEHGESVMTNQSQSCIPCIAPMFNSASQSHDQWQAYQLQSHKSTGHE